MSLHHHDIYIAVLFSPTSLGIVLHRDVHRNPYLDLYEDIIQFLTVGEVILLMPALRRILEGQTTRKTPCEHYMDEVSTIFPTEE
jgi:hypothetical protein